MPSLSLDGGTLAAARIAVNAADGIRSLAINAGGIASGAAMRAGAGGLVELPADARLSLELASLDVAEEAGGGRLEVGAGELLIAAGGITAEQVRADLIAGRNGGSWDGRAGITSALAAASGSTRAVGYTVAGDGSVRVAFAAPGDTNLDGFVDLIDLLAILGAGGYEQPIASVWAEGDFNYDGVTDLLDLLGILGSGTYDQGLTTPTATVPFGTVAAVPEPSGCRLVVTILTVSTWFGRRSLRPRSSRMRPS